MGDQDAAGVRQTGDYTPREISCIRMSSSGHPRRQTCASVITSSGQAMIPAKKGYKAVCFNLQVEGDSTFK
jgi:hypothetical protein